MEYKPQIVRSKRKTIQVEVRADCSVIVRAPYYTQRSEIDGFLEEKDEWIKKNIEKMRKRNETLLQTDKLSRQEVRELAERALADIPPRVRYYASVMGIRYGIVTIRNQRTRWGSCSSKGNLNFNCLLMLLPEEVRDYVIIHELCHIPEPNHSRAFWAMVEKYCPDHKRIRKYLTDEGDALMMRL